MKNVFKKIRNTTVLVVDWKGEKYFTRYEVLADMKELEEAYAGSDLVSEAKQRAKKMTVAEALKITGQLAWHERAFERREKLLVDVLKMVTKLALEEK